MQLGIIRSHGLKEVMRANIHNHKLQAGVGLHNAHSISSGGQVMTLKIQAGVREQIRLILLLNTA